MSLNDLVLGEETFVGKLVVGHQVCTDLSKDFGPPLITETF